MTKNPEEILYKAFETCLSEVKELGASEVQQFCEKVASKQLEFLRREGFAVPKKYEDLLKKELVAETLDMYRKKTYGASNGGSKVKVLKKTKPPA